MHFPFVQNEIVLNHTIHKLKQNYLLATDACDALNQAISQMDFMKICGF